MSLNLRPERGRSVHPELLAQRASASKLPGGEREQPRSFRRSSSGERLLKADCDFQAWHAPAREVLAQDSGEDREVRSVRVRHA